MTETTLVKQALGLLRIWEARREAYHKVNAQWRELQGDFPSLVQMVDVKIESAIVAMLDAILGDELASYYLYEVHSMRHRKGGLIVVDGVEHKLRSVDDVERYIKWRSKHERAKAAA